ncbi:hypothetical protein [Kitasatospora sp. NPDC059673]|uniref:hypothetical protein n=1 Tax=Kitasatospora sp. NPDC059673 TaxID=3346901 RepID=UPI0036B2D03C
MDRLFRLAYRTPQEVAAWRARDPLVPTAAALSAGAAAAIDAEVVQLLSSAVEFALASADPDPATAGDHLYASGLWPRSGAAL